MKSKAAILWEAGADWSVEDIVLDDPRAGEVKIQMAASGICHSDEHLVTGDMILPPEIAELVQVEQFPVIGGHEGAGVVVEVGPGVTTLREGDHVVVSFVPACGRCPSCARGRQHLCDLGAFLLAGLQVTDFTARHHTEDGRDVALMCCAGTFEPYTVVAESSCVKIDDWIPLDKAALVSCGVTTGWGSAVNAARVEAGDTVVVVGIGGVGMNAVQGASMAGARHVVAVDPEGWKTELAVSTFGATHAAASMEEAQALVGDLTWGANADKVILTASLATGDLIAPVMGMVTKGGRAVVTSASPILQTQVELSLVDLTMQRKELVGCIFGNANPRRDIPRLLRLYDEGKLKLDELITSTYALDDVNQGFQDMRDGKTIRGVVTFD